MEDKILKKLDDMSLQLHEINQRMDGFDQRFEKIDQRFEEVDQKFESIDKKFETTKEEIITTLRDEFDTKLDDAISAISKDVGMQINDLCVTIEKWGNEKHSEIRQEIREYKARTLKGVKAFEKVLTA